MTGNNIKEKIRVFIVNNFLSGIDSSTLNDDDSFLDKGIIDSTGVLELVTLIEETFNFRIEDEELMPDNLDSINKITVFVSKKTKRPVL